MSHSQAVVLTRSKLFFQFQELLNNMDPSRYSRYFTYIKPVLRNKTVRTYSSLVFSVITITVFALYAIKPTLSTIVSLQKSITEQNALLEQVNQKRSALEQGKQNLGKIKQETRDKLDSMLPTYSSIPSLIDTLNKLASENQASISGIQFQPIILETPPQRLNKNASLKEVLFTMNAVGTNASLTNLVNALNKADRLIIIDSITYNKPLDSPIVLSITAKAYYLKN